MSRQTIRKMEGDNDCMERELKARREIVKVLRGLPPRKRLPVIRAAALLLGLPDPACGR